MKRFSIAALFLLALALAVVLTPSRADFSSPYSIGPRPTTFAGLGTPNAGQVRFCSDCQATSPCTSGGTGAIATRLAGAWNCATGSAGTALSDSASLRSALSDETGTGAAVFQGGNIGAASATSVTLGSDDAYDATSWNGSLAVPTKNAVRDKIESLGGGGTTAGERLLSTTTFDVDNGAAQTLYTVPASKAVLVTRVLLRSSSVPLDSGGSNQITVTAAGGTVFTLTLSSLTTTTRVNWQTRASGVFIQAAAASLITAAVDSPYGSAATCVIELYGIEY